MEKNQEQALSLESLGNVIAEELARQVKADIHSHMTPLEWSELALQNFSSMLCFHYVVAEFNQYLNRTLHPRFPIPDWDEEEVDRRVKQPEGSAERQELAQMVWDTLFVQNIPSSAATRGVLETLHALDIDFSDKNFGRIQAEFDGIADSERLDLCFQLANTAFTVMTNDPWNADEVRQIEDIPVRDPRFKFALRYDAVFSQEGGPEDWLKSVAEKYNWLQQFGHICYLAASLPANYSENEKILEFLIEHMLPFARSHNQRLALMIGTKRQVNPRMGLAGDAFEDSDLIGLLQLCRVNNAHPGAKTPILATVLPPNLQKEFTILSRKFSFLIPFGIWWFNLGQSTLTEVTRYREEWLGSGYIPIHTDGRHPGHLIYKMNGFNRLYAKLLADVCRENLARGFPVSREAIRRKLRLQFWDLPCRALGLNPKHEAERYNNSL